MRCGTVAPDLAIIDLGLPDCEGLDLLKKLQACYPCAVIILTGRAEVADRVLGLELGADDYLVKPFDPRELAARARTVIRRYQLGEAATGARRTAAAADPAAAIASLPAASPLSVGVPLPAGAPSAALVAHFGAWAFDPATFRLHHAEGEAQTLTATEVALLMTFLQQPNRILTREALAGTHALEAFDRSIDVRVSRLRKKLRDDPHAPKIIKTVYGAGYLFALPVVWRPATDPFSDR